MRQNTRISAAPPGSIDAGPGPGRSRVLAALSAVLLAGPGCTYSPNDADKLVSSPRAGRVLADNSRPQHGTLVGVALVYSHREEVNLKLLWEEGHPLDLHKGRRIFHKLVEDGAIRPEDVFVPAESDDAMLRAVHDQRYLDSLNDRGVFARIMGSGFARSQSDRDHRERIVRAFRTAVGGTMLASELAAAHGLAVHLGGGFSHAFVDRGSRGSPLADVPIAMHALRSRKLAQRILVVDLGALQANGIASLMAGDPDGYLFDVYEQDNYPPTKQPEVGGIPVGDGIGNAEYQRLLEKHLPKVLDEFEPQFVFFLAGVDVVRGDPVGRSALDLSGLVTRDLYVVQQVRSRNIPLCMVLDGGGARDSWKLHYRSIRGLLARYGGVPFQPTIGEK